MALKYRYKYCKKIIHTDIGLMINRFYNGMQIKKSVYILMLPVI